MLIVQRSGPRLTDLTAGVTLWSTCLPVTWYYVNAIYVIVTLRDILSKTVVPRAVMATISKDLHGRPFFTSICYYNIKSAAGKSTAHVNDLLSTTQVTTCTLTRPWNLPTAAPQTQATRLGRRAWRHQNFRWRLNTVSASGTPCLERTLARWRCMRR